MLLQNDADRNVINNFGKSPIDVAKDEGEYLHVIIFFQS